MRPVNVYTQALRAFCAKFARAWITEMFGRRDQNRSGLSSAQYATVIFPELQRHRGRDVDGDNAFWAAWRQFKTHTFAMARMFALSGDSESAG